MERKRRERRRVGEINRLANIACKYYVLCSNSISESPTAMILMFLLTPPLRVRRRAGNMPIKTDRPPVRSTYAPAYAHATWRLDETSAARAHLLCAHLPKLGRREEDGHLPHADLLSHTSVVLISQSYESLPFSAMPLLVAHRGYAFLGTLDQCWSQNFPKAVRSLRKVLLLLSFVKNFALQLKVILYQTGQILQWQKWRK